MEGTRNTARPGVAQRPDVAERPGTTPTDGEDRERFSHIVFTPGRKAEAVVLEARVTGTPITALCGKRWIPSRDPQKFPLCPTCKEIRDRATAGR